MDAPQPTMQSSFVQKQVQQIEQDSIGPKSQVSVVLSASHTHLCFLELSNKPYSSMKYISGPKSPCLWFLKTKQGFVFVTYLFFCQAYRESESIRNTATTQLLFCQDLERRLEIRIEELDIFQKEKVSAGWTLSKP